MKLATIVGGAFIAAGFAIGVLLAEYVVVTGEAHAHRGESW